MKVLNRRKVDLSKGQDAESLSIYRSTPIALAMEEGTEGGTTSEGTWVELLRTGSIIRYDWWNMEYYELEIEDEDLEAIITNFASESNQIPYNIDHWSYFDGGSRGWVSEVELRENKDDGNSVFGFSKFTKEAVGLIEDEVYKYVSVELSVKTADEGNQRIADGSAVNHHLTGVALTNYPAVRDMEEIALNMQRQGFGMFGAQSVNNRNPHPEVSMKVNDDGTVTLTAEEHTALQTRASQLSNTADGNTVTLSKEEYAELLKRPEVDDDVVILSKEDHAELLKQAEVDDSVVSLSNEEHEALNNRADAGDVAMQSLRENEVATMLSGHVESGRLKPASVEAHTKRIIGADDFQTMFDIIDDTLKDVEENSVVNLGKNKGNGEGNNNAGDVDDISQTYKNAVKEETDKGVDQLTARMNARKLLNEKYSKEEVNAWRYQETGNKIARG